MTDAEIRNKMYLWIINKGIKLEDKDRKEIKEIMNEYLNFSNPTKIVPSKKSIIKKRPTVSVWRNYP
jgi:hypothetical protein